MRKKKFNKLLSVVLVAVMAIAFLPISALAQSEEEVIEPTSIVEVFEEEVTPEEAVEIVEEPAAEEVPKDTSEPIVVDEVIVEEPAAVEEVPEEEAAIVEEEIAVEEPIEESAIVEETPIVAVEEVSEAPILKKALRSPAIVKTDVTIQLSYKSGTYGNLVTTWGEEPVINPIIIGEDPDNPVQYTIDVAPLVDNNPKMMPAARKVTITVNPDNNPLYNVTLLDYNGKPVSGNTFTANISYMTRPVGINYPTWYVVYGDSLPASVIDSVSMDNVLESDRPNVSLVFQEARDSYRYSWDEKSGRWTYIDGGLFNVADLVPGAQLQAGTYPYYLWYNNHGKPDPSGNTAQNMRYPAGGALGNIYITPRPVIITANNLTKTYGESDPELTGTGPELVYGDTMDYSFEREPGNTVGEYAIDVLVDWKAQPNYSISTVSGTLTINPATLIVKGASNSVVYDGNEHTVTDFTIEGLKYEDKVISGITYVAAGTEVNMYNGAFTIDPTTLLIENKDGEDVTNCYTIVQEPGQLEITPLPVTPVEPTPEPEPDPDSSPTIDPEPEPEPEPEPNVEPTPTPKPDKKPTKPTKPAVTPEPEGTGEVIIIDIPVPVIPTPGVVENIEPPTPIEELPDIAPEPVQEKEPEVVQPTPITDPSDPTAGLGGPSWSLLNLILMLLGILTGIVYFLGIFRHGKTREEEDEYGKVYEIKHGKGTMISRILTILLGILGVIVFFVFENLRTPMIFINWLTPWMVLIFVALAICALITIRKTNKEQQQQA